VMERHKWMADALCTREDPEVFFPGGTTSKLHARKQRAKEICGRCPVQTECLEYAVGLGWLFDGIWAGLEADQIRKLARDRAGQPATTPRRGDWC